MSLSFGLFPDLHKYKIQAIVGHKFTWKTDIKIKSKRLKNQNFISHCSEKVCFAFADMVICLPFFLNKINIAK